MSEHSRKPDESPTDAVSPVAKEAPEEPHETPFDHPLFLPVVLLGLTLWFGYDGFLNQDPEMLEHLTFNRGGFAVLGALTLYFGWRGLREFREEREQRDADDGGKPPPIA